MSLDRWRSPHAPGFTRTFLDADGDPVAPHETDRIRAVRELTVDDAGRIVRQVYTVLPGSRPAS